MDQADPNALSLPELARRLVDHPATVRLLEAAREEDLGECGDVTSRSVIPAARRMRAAITAREPGVVAGLAVVPEICRVFRSGVTLEPALDDGDRCDAGQRLGVLEGPVRGVLGVERTVLNLLGQLSGVATTTHRHVELCVGTRAVVCETRKTVPGMRRLQKYAVRCGGGHLHRLGLHDAALYKDNHLAALPPGPLDETLVPALRRVRDEGPLRFVMVEVDTMEQLEELLRIDEELLDLVLLDNMPPETLRRAVERRDALRPRWRLEASGGITRETIASIAATGVDRISVGGLTHSVRCLDVGLDALAAAGDDDGDAGAGGASGAAAPGAAAPELAP